MKRNNRFNGWIPPVFDEDGWAYKKTVCGYPVEPYHWRCQHPEKLKMGKETDVGCFTYMNAKYGIEIGNDVKIGSHCSIYSESTIHGKHSGVLKGKITIGDFVMIGSHSVIMPGVAIGNDAIVGACSFVKHDVDVGCLVGGVPAFEVGTVFVCLA